MRSYICCGMQYGDEGKGSFVDWITHNTEADCIIKYNGGSHASHTVQTPDGIIHKFAQLGSGMFKEGCHTYITEDMVVNPDNLLREMQLFAEQTGNPFSYVKERVHIHKRCLIVTPYHRLLSNLRELSLGKDRTGRVGSGVSEVPTLWNVKTGCDARGIGITMEELYSKSVVPVMGGMQRIWEYVYNFYKEHEKDIWDNCPEDLKDTIRTRVDDIVLDTKQFLRIATALHDAHNFYRNENTLGGCLYSTYEESCRQHECAVWEGSQGFLIDKTYGIAPNTTKLVTTNEPAIAKAYLLDDITKIGIASAMCSRHGKGIFMTEDMELSRTIEDKNQDISYWNGSPWYGWFDAVALRYANSVNKVDYLCLSHVDRLSGKGNIKICTAYSYDGETDEEFFDVFECEARDGLYIKNIKKNHPRLKEWLLKTTPIYEELKGWDGVGKKLPEEVKAFIKAVEKHTGIKVGAVSIGPTREDKILLDGQMLK